MFEAPAYLHHRRSAGCCQTPLKTLMSCYGLWQSMYTTRTETVPNVEFVEGLLDQVSFYAKTRNLVAIDDLVAETKFFAKKIHRCKSTTRPLFISTTYLHIYISTTYVQHVRCLRVSYRHRRPDYTLERAIHCRVFLSCNIASVLRPFDRDETEHTRTPETVHGYFCPDDSVQTCRGHV